MHNSFTTKLSLSDDFFDEAASIRCAISTFKLYEANRYVTDDLTFTENESDAVALLV